MTLLAPNWLGLLLLVPLALALMLIGRALSSAALRRFGDRVLLQELLDPPSRLRRACRAALLLCSLGAIAVALARPAWNPTPSTVTRTGRDVVFLIDVSRSMLAPDLRPNRLERAKLAIGDVLDEARGDRVAIIAFAGTAVIKCPLTTDYAFARLALDELDTNSVSRGGSLIGDAIRTALDELFGDDGDTDPEARFRDIFLITDGEDQESFPIQAAQAAGERGVRIVAIGLGAASGTPIPTAEGFLEFEGEVVRSSLDADTLERVASASRDGLYLNVATGTIELDRIYRALVRRAERREIEAVQVLRYQEGFQLLLALALACLLLEPLIGERRRG